MKKKVLLFVGLMLCLLLVGCGKEDSVKKTKKMSEMIPNPQEYFLGDANITTLQDDDKGLYYYVENCSEDDYDKYVEKCKELGFSNIEYQSSDEKQKLFTATNDDGTYKLDVDMELNKKYVNIIGNIQE